MPSFCNFDGQCHQFLLNQVIVEDVIMWLWVIVGRYSTGYVSSETEPQSNNHLNRFVTLADETRCDHILHTNFDTSRMKVLNLQRFI
jgi:hypothetical protein